RCGSALPQGSDPVTRSPGFRPCRSMRLARWLLVLDQIGDYAVAHQARFVRGHTMAAPEQFEEANADWAAIGSLVCQGSIRLLIVCRADAAGILDALRFTRATTFRIGGH
ncbi:MAG: hypothetical protein ACREF9_20010, partial [Opitutaceae bacterium]